MRKIFVASAIGALALCLTAAPAAVAKKGPKDVGGTVTVVPVPSTLELTTATVAVSGNVKASSGCRKSRTVSFSYVDGAVTTPLSATALTGPNGDYSVTLPRPTTTGPSVTLLATVDQTARTTKGQSKGKGKKKGHAKGKARKFNCLAITGQSTLTLNS